MNYENLNTEVNPGDDFYKYVTSHWIIDNPQPSEYPKWTTFSKLADDNIKRINRLITEVDDTTEYGKKIKIFRDMYMDMKKRSETRFNTVNRIKEELISIKSKEDLLTYMFTHRNTLLTSMYLGADEQNSSKYEIHLTQGGMFLNNRDYYMLDRDDIIKVRKAYRKYFKDVMNYIGCEDIATDEVFDNVFEAEYRIAEVAYSEEQLQDPSLNYHMFTIDELMNETEFPWYDYLQKFGYDEPQRVIVGDVDAVIMACKLYNELPLETLKIMFLFDEVTSLIGYMDELGEDISFEFNQVLSGAKEKMPREKKCINAINAWFEDEIGQLYVARYFSESDKKFVTNMVENLRHSFEKIIESQSWMEDSTKAYAIDKLKSMKLKIGYPNKWDDNSDMPLSETKSLTENIYDMRIWSWDKYIRKYYKKDVDAEEWAMPPQMVNACYDPTKNDITFPAAILQYPFYSPSMTISEIYGGIGVIIGHEMTHGFDNHGRLIDKSGNLFDWWTENDVKKFDEFTNITREHFNGLNVLDDLKADGSLTLSENIADYGGIKIAYNALKKIAKEVVLIKKDNMKWNQQFFISYANAWSGVLTDDSIRTQTITNEHSIPRLRVNGTLPMFNEWYDAFKVDETNALYVPKDKRAKIW